MGEAVTSGPVGTLGARSSFRVVRAFFVRAADNPVGHHSGGIFSFFSPVQYTPRLAIMPKNLNVLRRCYNSYVIQCLRTPFRSQHAAGADPSPGLLQSGTVVPPSKQGAASLPSRSLAPWA